MNNIFKVGLTLLGLGTSIGLFYASTKWKKEINDELDEVLKNDKVIKDRKEENN